MELMQNPPEPDWELYELFDNLAALIRAEERKKCVELGLQPIHLQMLNYLFRANDYNNTPGATADYLGITRGPASQSLIILEKRGLIEKVSDPFDRRLVHIRLLPKGVEFLKRARPVDLFKSFFKKRFPNYKKPIKLNLLAFVKIARTSHKMNRAFIAKFYKNR